MMRLLLICLIRQKKIIPTYPINCVFICVFIMSIQWRQNVLLFTLNLTIILKKHLRSSKNSVRESFFKIQLMIPT